MDKKTKGWLIILAIIIAAIIVIAIIVNLNGGALFSPGVGSGSIANSCRDTDGGINRLVRGTVSGYSGGNRYAYTDFCLTNQSASLKEYYCMNTSWTSTSINCWAYNGTCLNGTCSR